MSFPVASRRRRHAAFTIAAASLTLLVSVGIPGPLSAVSFLSAGTLVVSFLLAVYLPRRLARVAGRVAAVAFSMIVLGAIGAGIGALSVECATWSSACRREVGGWLVTWMLLVPALGLVVVLARGMRTVVTAPVRIVRRTLANRTTAARKRSPGR